MNAAAAGPALGQGFLSLQALTKRYHDFIAVDSIDLDVEQGEFVSLLGPSGCGKTTTLRMIAGLVPTTGGRMLIGSKDLTHVPPFRRDMGLVFQSYALFPHMTVADNIAFGLEMRNYDKAEIRQRVAEAIALVRLEGREDSKPNQLSGGQQQRVALARALVIRPSILLLDEPLSNLDAKLREEMRGEIRDIQRRLGITAIFVTHDQDEALTMSDRVVVMNQGRIEQAGTPETLYERPATPFVAAFVGRTNRLDGIQQGNRIVISQLSIDAATAMSGPVEVMIRPHRIHVSSSNDKVPAGGNRVQGVVTRVTYAGNVVQYEIDASGTRLIAEAATMGQIGHLSVGTQVTACWAVEDTLVFGRMV